MSLARTAKRKWRSVDPVLRALILSVLVHAIVFGSWKVADGLGISEKLPLFNLSKKTEELLAIQPAQAALNIPVEREIELAFVEVDLTKAAEDPKDAKYYGAVSTQAANPVPIKDTDTPKIEGTSKEVSKLTENEKAKPQPLQPTPPPPTRLAEQDKEFKEETKLKEIQTPGDLASKKPSN
ncbi:MAG: hypothetical protein ACK4UN_08405, partial [Limisphaerales bacterium]